MEQSITSSHLYFIGRQTFKFLKMCIIWWQRNHTHNCSINKYISSTLCFQLPGITRQRTCPQVDLTWCSIHTFALVLQLKTAPSSSRTKTRITYSLLPRDTPAYTGLQVYNSYLRNLQNWSLNRRFSSWRKTIGIQMETFDNSSWETFEIREFVLYLFFELCFKIVCWR